MLLTAFAGIASLRPTVITEPVADNITNRESVASAIVTPGAEAGSIALVLSVKNVGSTVGRADGPKEGAKVGDFVGSCVGSKVVDTDAQRELTP